MAGFDVGALPDVVFDAVAAVAEDADGFAAVAAEAVVFTAPEVAEVAVFAPLEAVGVVVLAAVLPELAFAAAGEGLYDTAGVDFTDEELVAPADFDAEELLLIDLDAADEPVEAVLDAADALPVDFDAEPDEVDVLFDDDELLVADLDDEELELLDRDDEELLPDLLLADDTAMVNPP